jgi:pyruvate carboxylase subunit A
VIKKILIANRGEIAVRIVRACAEMGITSVAIFTDADRHSLHVKKADEAYNIGPESVEGYLNAHRIVNLAVAAGCDAIHPGYGFLAENPEIARACERRRVRFIGPNAEVIEKMGDKIAARQLMLKAGIPVLPGSDGSVADVNEAAQIAAEVGYPVMLKATNGGGGRGIRQVANEEELRHQYDRVISEATKAFGSPFVFVEKCVINPRHIEVQILADKYGNVIHLFERDCSIQRRHQKLLEIAPSPQLNDEQRAEVCEYGVRAAKAAGYENAGTVEFLLDQEGRFHFMEMNTRIQVEHTVTEQITGIDIVQEQIRIAAGKRLSLKQEQVQRRGFAIEFRINAEDPKNDFLPSFGKITRYYAPGGPGVRTDTAIYTGYEIPPYYDSMVAKLTVWAMDWNKVIARSGRALLEMGVFGVRTTIPYHREILSSEEFQNASFDTSFILNHPELTHYSTRARRDDVAAVIAAAIAAHMGA